MTPESLLQKLQPWLMEGFLVLGINKGAKKNGNYVTGITLVGGTNGKYVMVDFYDGPEKEERDAIFERLSFFYEGMGIERWQEGNRKITKDILDDEH